MRIVHVSDGYLPRPGGIESQVHDLAWAQAAAGHEVEIVTATPGGRPSDDLVVHRLRNDRDRGGAGPVRDGVRQALSARYDVVHVHLSIVSPLGMSALWSAASGARRVVATMHSMCGPTEFALPQIRRVFGRRVHAVEWTAVSAAAADPLRRGLGVPVSVVPNGVDVSWWGRSNPPAPDAALRVVSVMRLTRRKRPLPLLRMVDAAGARSRRGDSPLTAAIVGDGRLYTRTRRAADRMRVPVTLTGQLARRDVREVVSGHDVYVAPAPLESFGLAALEARSAGLPVVAFRRSGVADFVRDGWDGVLVDSDDQLVAALAELARHPELVEQLRSNARTRPAFGWPHTLAGYERAYAAADRRVPLPPAAIGTPG